MTLWTTRVASRPRITTTTMISTSVKPVSAAWVRVQLVLGFMELLRGFVVKRSDAVTAPRDGGNAAILPAVSTARRTAVASIGQAGDDQALPMRLLPTVVAATAAVL